MSASSLRIGALADASAVSVDTIRYYERVGLLPRAPRQRSGYRAYDPATITRLTWIRAARQVGFSLAAIRDLLHAFDRAPMLDAGARVTFERRLCELDRRIAALIDLRDQMRRVLGSSGVEASATERVAASAPTDR